MRPLTLAVDIGNTRIKAGLFAGDDLLATWKFLPADWPAALVEGVKIHASASEVKYTGLCNVGNLSSEEVMNSLKQAFPVAEAILIQSKMRLPLQIRYETPETLGGDRLAAAAGALKQAGKGPLIVFSAGTALTWEIINENNEYIGGGIAPGMRMRLRSLHEFTARLPLVESEGPIGISGNSTENSIRAGAVMGVVLEIDAIISEARRLFSPGMPSFITGGDAVFLGNHLKNINFVEPDLALKGISAIVQSNFADA